MFGLRLQNDSIVLSTFSVQSIMEVEWVYSVAGRRIFVFIDESQRLFPTRMERDTEDLGELWTTLKWLGGMSPEEARTVCIRIIVSVMYGAPSDLLELEDTGNSAQPRETLNLQGADIDTKMVRSLSEFFN